MQAISLTYPRSRSYVKPLLYQSSPFRKSPLPPSVSRCLGPPPGPCWACLLPHHRAVTIMPYLKALEVPVFLPENCEGDPSCPEDQYSGSADLEPAYPSWNPHHPVTLTSPQVRVLSLPSTPGHTMHIQFMNTPTVKLSQR